MLQTEPAYTATCPETWSKRHGAHVAAVLRQAAVGLAAVGLAAAG